MSNREEYLCNLRTIINKDGENGASLDPLWLELHEKADREEQGYMVLPPKTLVRLIEELVSLRASKYA